VSRILLLLVFVVWMTGWSAADPALGGRGGAPATAPDLTWTGALPFVAFYALLVLVLGLYSRVLARRVAADNMHRSLRRFNWMMLAARVLIPAWLAVGVFVPQMGWLACVHWVLDHTVAAIPGNDGAIRSRVLLMLYLPSVLVGTLPALLAWVGLIWAQYPADRALREQNMLAHLEADLPLHAAPRFGSYFAANLRLQVLFIVVPVLLIMLSHDALLIAGVQLFKHYLPRKAFLTKFDSDLLSHRLQWIEMGAQAVSFVLVFVFAPEVLRRVLQTEPLPNGPLRRRLEAMCERTGMRCRQILLWRTQNNMGNAAVMGFVPQVRYVLLSDLLLESMTDEQVEAVFAHEIGHVVHRHMAWYVVFIAAMAMLFAGPGQALAGQLEAWRVPERVIDALGMVGFAGAIFAGFMFLSQRCERQADVYAARTMEAARAAGNTNGANGHSTATAVSAAAPAVA
jgi:Zn-dependent protease with chaperone function